MNDNCIFCKIAAGIIPSATVYEDDDFRAILDIAPAHKGHVIILPKVHADNLFSLSDEVASKLLPVARRLRLPLRRRPAATALIFCKTTEPPRDSPYSICMCMWFRGLKATESFPYGPRAVTRTGRLRCLPKRLKRICKNENHETPSRVSWVFFCSFNAFRTVHITVSR